MKNIIVGENAGFCFGVSNAINKTYQILSENKKLYCLGKIVHNEIVNTKLEKAGLKFIDNINEVHENLIIRTHGVSKEIYNQAEKEGLNIYNLTCPKVLKTQKIVSEYSNNQYYIFLIGNKNHPEIIATISYCHKNSYIIENE